MHAQLSAMNPASSIANIVVISDDDELEQEGKQGKCSDSTC